MNSERLTQCQKMLTFAAENGGITTADATYKLGILSPTRRVCDIKKLGYAVRKTWETVTDRFGNKTQVRRYTFVKEGAK